MQSLYSLSSDTAQQGVAAKPAEAATLIEVGGFGGGLGINATMPFMQKWRYERAHYPSDMVDLKKWSTDAEIRAALGG